MKFFASFGLLVSGILAFRVFITPDKPNDSLVLYLNDILTKDNATCKADIDTHLPNSMTVLHESSITGNTHLLGKHTFSCKDKSDTQCLVEATYAAHFVSPFTSTWAENLIRVGNWYEIGLRAQDPNYDPKTPKNDGITWDFVDTFDETWKNLSAKVGKFIEFDMKNIPFFPWLNDSANFKEPSPDVLAAIQETEQYLHNQYDKQMISHSWHGMLSFQRVFWQDPKVQSLLSSKENVRGILRYDPEKLSKFVKTIPVNFKWFILMGLFANNPSYLATVSPNWEWTSIKAFLGSMNLPKAYKKDYEVPYIVTKETFETFGKIFTVVDEVLDELLQEKGEDSKTIVGEVIGNKWTNTSMMNICKDTMTDEEKAEKVTQGKAGASTVLDQMYRQRFDVMKVCAFDADGKPIDYDVSVMLGYAMITHALDARHLAASIYYYTNGNVSEFVKRFLSIVDSDNKEDKACTLMRIRLKQVLKVMKQIETEVGDALVFKFDTTRAVEITSA